MSAENENAGVASENLPKEEAIERLAEALQFKTEHLDPGEGDWSELDDRSREHYRQLVKWLLLHRELLLAALT